MSIKIYTAYRVAKGVDPFELLFDLKRRGREEAKKRLRLIFEDILNGKAEEAAHRIAHQNVAFGEWCNANGHEISSDRIFGLYQTWLREHCPPELKEKNGAAIAVTNKQILTEIGRKEDAEAEGIKPSIFDIDTWMSKKYGAQLSQTRRNPWALDTTITLRPYRSRYYLIPYCDGACAVAGSLNFLADDPRLEDFAYWNNTDKPKEVTDHEWAWRATVWNDLTDWDRWPNFVEVSVVSWDGWIYFSPAMDILREKNEQGKLTAEDL